MAKNETLRITVLSLEPRAMTRTETLELAARAANRVGQVAIGKGCARSSGPLEWEFRNAAGTIGYDLSEILTHLAEHPDAETIELVRGEPNASEAWLALAAFYWQEGGQVDPEEMDREVAPLAAALRGTREAA